MIWKIALHLPFESVRRVIDWSVGVFLMGLLMYRLGEGLSFGLFQGIVILFL